MAWGERGLTLKENFHQMERGVGGSEVLDYFNRKGHSLGDSRKSQMFVFACLNQLRPLALETPTRTGAQVDQNP